MRNLRRTVKHGDDSVMVRGRVAANGTGNLLFIDGIYKKYLFTCMLKESLKQSAEKLGLLIHSYFRGIRTES